jgi:hypothetical protein
VIELASAEALAVADEPREAKAPDVTEPAETTEPSAGNAKLPPTPTASGGAETEAAELPPWPGTVTWIAKALAVGPGAAAWLRAAEAEPTDRTSRLTPRARVVSRATPGIMRVGADGPRGSAIQCALGGGSEALTDGLVGSRRVLLLAFGRDLLGHRPQLLQQLRTHLGLAGELLDPGLGAVTGRVVTLDEQPAEDDSHSDVTEGSEREQLLRRVDEPADVLVLALELTDDLTDRLVDERDPDLVLHELRIDRGRARRAAPPLRA